MLFWSIYINKTEIEVIILSKSRSAGLVDESNFWKEWIQTMIHIWQL